MIFFFFRGGSGKDIVLFWFVLFPLFSCAVLLLFSRLFFSLSFLFRCATLRTPEAYLHDYRPLNSCAPRSRTVIIFVAACGFMSFKHVFF